MQLLVVLFVEPLWLQSLPPNSGTGLLHGRVLIWSPLPQLTEQILHEFHSFHPPSTEKNNCMMYISNKKYIKYLVLNLISMQVVTRTVNHIADFSCAVCWTIIIASSSAIFWHWIVALTGSYLITISTTCRASTPWVPFTPTPINCKKKIFCKKIFGVYSFYYYFIFVLFSFLVYILYSILFWKHYYPDKEPNCSF